MSVIESGLSLLAPRASQVSIAVATPPSVAPTAAAMAVATNTSTFNAYSSLPQVKVVSSPILVVGKSATMVPVAPHVKVPSKEFIGHIASAMGVSVDPYRFSGRYTFFQLVMVAIAAILLAVCVFFLVRYIYHALIKRGGSDRINPSTLVYENVEEIQT